MTRLGKFLKKNGVFENFAKNINPNHQRGIVNEFLKKNSRNPHAVSHAFDWDKTSEGNEMWSRVSATWYMRNESNQENK